MPTNPAAPVDFSAWGFDDATAQFGLQMGQNAVAAGQDYVQKKVRVRSYFLLRTRKEGSKANEDALVTDSWAGGCPSPL